jgi:hypothetical protein
MVKWVNGTVFDCTLHAAAAWLCCGCAHGLNGADLKGSRCGLRAQPS